MQALKGLQRNAQKQLDVLKGGFSKLSTQDSADDEPLRDDICTKCKVPFSRWRRRYSCPACNRHLCCWHYGGTVVGVPCCCWRSACAACTLEIAENAEFHRDVCPNLVSGSSAMTKDASDKVIPVWVSLDKKKATMTWASLEQRANKPVFQGSTRVGAVVQVRATAADLTLTMEKDARTLTFADAQEAEYWRKGVHMATDVLSSDKERKTRRTALQQLRTTELAERKQNAEERKAKFADAGMRYTAEAMSKLPATTIGKAAT
mmetsp:Transcript_1655/g.3707  ORF Transcript_1655/g.3707 Transcript_1655/m.3707 type:complete len:262 (-) Transcript_1655:102-887(-)